MKKYESISLLKSLPFCQTPLEQVNQQLKAILATAESDRVGARSQLRDMVLQHGNLDYCAEFQVFLMKFELVSGSISGAYDVLQNAFSIYAQPTSMLKSAQTYLFNLAAYQGMEVLPQLEHYRVLQAIPELSMKNGSYKDEEVDTALWEQFLSEGAQQRCRRYATEEENVGDMLNVLGDIPTSY